MRRQPTDPAPFNPAYQPWARDVLELVTLQAEARGDYERYSREEMAVRIQRAVRERMASYETYLTGA
jgi:hypothetical protein